MRDRKVKIVGWCMAATVVIMAMAGQLCGQITATFHPQPRPSKHVRVWSATVCNDGPAPVTVNHATLARYTAGRLALLNVYARGYEQGRQPRHIVARIGDTLAGLGDGFVAGVATGAIKYDGRLTIAAAVYSGVWKIAGGVYRETRNLALTGQPFWDERPVQLAPGGCVEAAVAALRNEDKAARRLNEATSIEIEIPSRPALGAIGRLERFDCLDWDRQAAEALRDIARAACLVRPSSVESEGCGAWYG